jgi:hypothetical protein
MMTLNQMTSIHQLAFRMEAHDWHIRDPNLIECSGNSKSLRLMGRQSAILVDPFSELHHQ